MFGIWGKRTQAARAREDRRYHAAQKAEREVLESRIAALEAALYPFAEVGKVMQPVVGQSSITFWGDRPVTVTHGDFAIAAKVLEGEE